MFEKTPQKTAGTKKAAKPEAAAVAHEAQPKADTSVISAKMTIVGDITSEADVQLEGRVEGSIRARAVTVAKSAVLEGEVVADEIVVHGRVLGRVQGGKVTIAAGAEVTGDIVHKTLSVESGAAIEGTVSRLDVPAA